MSGRRCCSTLSAMPRFLLHHTHDRADCRIAFAAWRGFASPLRRSTVLASCLSGGHEIWWTVGAADEQDALSQLPPYVAKRTRAIRVSDVQIP
jgi:hypothetical protein